MDKEAFIKLCKSEVSKRNFINSMTTSGAKFERLWRPHNTRREIKIFPYEKKVKTTILKSKGFIVDTTIPYKMSSHTGIIDIRFTKNIDIQIKRVTVLGIWKQNIMNGEKETLLLYGDSKKEVLDKIDVYRLHINKLGESAVLFVVERFGLHSMGGFYKVRQEDWSRSIHFIDKLPEECIIHEDAWKKVYRFGVEAIEKKAVEEVDFFRQMISNEMVLDFAPEIAKEIVANRVLIKDFVDGVLPVMKDFSANIVSHTKVIKDMAVGFERFNDLLSRVDPSRFTGSFDVRAWFGVNIKFFPGDLFKHSVFISGFKDFENKVLWDCCFERFGGVER